jgi:hypothetical protein
MQFESHSVMINFDEVTMIILNQASTMRKFSPQSLFFNADVAEIYKDKRRRNLGICRV